MLLLWIPSRSSLASVAALCVLMSGCESANSGAVLEDQTPAQAQPKHDLGGAVLADSGPEMEVTMTKIQLILDDGSALEATLEDSVAARDFAALLPLELTLSDYANTEKVSSLPKKLNTQGAPAGIDPEPGDLTYYAPWGNLAIFYRDFGYATGLIKLGRLDVSAQALASKRRDFRVRIVRVEAD